MLFGAAGMITTREFITIAALHLISKPKLRDRFVVAGDVERRAILEEILRLEPVIGKLYRRTTAPMDLPNGEHVEAGQSFVIDLRSSNVDPEAVGACPFQLDPDRQMPDSKAGGAAMGFGDGRHRCPGAFIAMEESAIFLAKLLALPRLARRRRNGFRLERFGRQLRIPRMPYRRRLTPQISRPPASPAGPPGR